MIHKITKYLLLSLCLSFLFFAVPSNNQASATQNLTIPEISTLPGPTVEEQEAGTRKLLTQRVLPRYIVTLVGFVGIGALIFLVVSGVRFAMAYGNEEDITKAKNQAIYAIVGFVIAILAYTIVSIIANLELKSDSSGNSSRIDLIAQNE